MNCKEEMLRADAPGRLYVCALPAGHQGPHRDRCGDSWHGRLAATALLAVAACYSAPPSSPMASKPIEPACIAACITMQAHGCFISDDPTCPKRLTENTSGSGIPMPDGGALHCGDIVRASSQAELATIGIHCGAGP